MRSGADRKAIEVVRVPGSFEIPSAARAPGAGNQETTTRFLCVLYVVCNLRTAHYDVIVNEVPAAWASRRRNKVFRLPLASHLQHWTRPLIAPD